MDSIIVDHEYLLKKFPGKGGWTYAEIPEISQNPSNPFGWVKVKGSIDGYKISQFKLMPMGNGRLFLPVKTAIRKAIKKEAGDIVKIILYPDDSPVNIPEFIMKCFDMESDHLLENFKKLPDGEQKQYIDWINSAKKQDTIDQRILRMFEKLDHGLRFRDQLTP